MFSAGQAGRILLRLHAPMQGPPQEDFVMHLAFAFVTACAAFATFQSLRTVTIGEGPRRSRLSGSSLALTGVPRPPFKARLRWISAEELVRLISADPEMILFRLVDENSDLGRPQGPPGYLSVTVEGLRETLPWIPLSSRIAIYRQGGLDSERVSRISSILCGREVLLVSDAAVPALLDQTLHASEVSHATEEID